MIRASNRDRATAPLARAASVVRCSFLAIGILAAAGAVSGDAVRSAVEAEGRFLETVAAHVAAIENRDLDALLATITTGDRLTLIFPDATTTHTRQAYVDFHREWFADEGWTMEIEPVWSMVRGDLGIALVRTTYTDAAGPREALVALTFNREAGDWRLVFDQNTRIPEE